MKTFGLAATLFLLAALIAALGTRARTRAASLPSRTSTLRGARPLVIGHRGACGYRPEHTLASYGLAIEMGADFIEPDLVMTKDGALVARHEPIIGDTTDVADKFPGRRTKKTIDGQEIENWFVEDFTLAEIKTLRARERLPTRSHAFDGAFEIPTFEEILDLAARGSRETGRTIGVYPETKHPTYHRAGGRELEPAIARALAARGWTGRDAPVILQSFEPTSLERFRALGVRARMILLYEDAASRPYDYVAAGDARTYGDLTRPEELRRLARVVDGIGPWKGLIVPVVIGSGGSTSHLGAPTSLVDDAHAAGLFVHPYTFRGDREFLAAAYAGDPGREYAQFFGLGVDGVFTDFADQAVAARAKLEDRSKD